MKSSKKFNLPVQGKSVPRYGSSANYQSNVNPAFLGALAGMAMPLIGNVVKKLVS